MEFHRHNCNYYDIVHQSIVVEDSIAAKMIFINNNYIRLSNGLQVTFITIMVENLVSIKEYVKLLSYTINKADSYTCYKKHNQKGY